MESERSPLARTNVPRYTFLGSSDTPKQTARKFQCCMSALIIGLLLLTMAIIIWYYVDPALLKNNFSNSSQTLDNLLRLKWPLSEEKYNNSLVDSNDEKRAFAAGIKGLAEKDIIEDSLPSVPIDSPVFRHQIATHTSEEAQRMSRLGYLLNLGSREINTCMGSTPMNASMPKRWNFSHPMTWHPGGQCLEDVDLQCDLSSPYRTVNGTCNNLENKYWGAALKPFRRILLPKYADGIFKPRLASDGFTLPSAREVSLTIHRPVYKNDVNFTVMLAVWGQFIDHDITATAISRGKNGSIIKCCGITTVHPECFPVILPLYDPIYKKYNVTCMEFVRSAPAPICSFGPREQLNQVTSFLDGSVIYGNDNRITNELRTFNGGELKMLKTSFGELLPVSEDPNDGCNRRKELERKRYCFLSGDSRANENILLTSMHLLFAREHNLIANELSKINSHWSDEKLFQETRKIVAAQIQHITYSEFLPSVLPQELLNRLNISTKPSGYSQLYNSSVDATIANVFASAAFRFGHTLLPSLIQLSNKNKNKNTWEYIQLHKMLFDPFKLYEEEFLEKSIIGAMNTFSSKSDVHFTQEVTQKLFEKKKEKISPGLDLVSLNIQRGRDHGLPPYTDWRRICGLHQPKDFDDLKEDIEENVLNQLKGIYKAVDDIDLYTGGLSEKPLQGGMVGPTISCLLADQFLRLKIGDRFWYETAEGPQKFTEDQLREIKKTKLSTIICKTSEVKESQPNVMRKVGAGNEIQSCDSFSSPDFGAWADV